MKNLVSVLMMLFMAVSVSAQYSVGDKATDFSLKGVDGKNHSLADMADAKGYIVIFTCNHCPFSVMYEDRIIALQNEFGPKGYHVVAINPNDPAANADDSYELMIVRAKEKNFNFPYLYDDGQKVFPLYGAKKTPHVFLLDNDLTVQYIGAIDDSARDEEGVEERYLANAVNALIAGDKIDPNFTKAIGCSIKVKK